MSRNLTSFVLVVFITLSAACDDDSNPQGPGPSSGAYFVSPGGNDGNPGTYDEPWQTVSKAAATVVAGDSVYIRGGTYSEQVTLETSGTSDNYITIAAWQSEIPVLDGTAVSISGQDLAGLFQVLDASYIRISGITVQNAGPSMNAAGILLDGCSAVTVSSCRTYNTVSSGIAAWGCSIITITGNDVELACNDGEQECITVAGTSTFTVSDNIVHESGPGSIGGEGIDIKDGSSWGDVYGNVVFNINRLGIYIDSWDKETHHIEVYGNRVYGTVSDGYVLAAENGGLLHDIMVYNNIACDNLGSGVVVAGWGEPGAAHPMENLLIINNTLYANGTASWGCGVSIENSEADDVTVRNNIFSQNTTDQISTEAYGTGLLVDYNLIDGPTEVYGSNYQEGSPMFADTTCSNFHLTAASPAIDNGSSDLAPSVDFDGVSRPQGSAFDIGAFEYTP
jgi:hypothetical protein